MSTRYEYLILLDIKYEQRVGEVQKIGCSWTLNWVKIEAQRYWSYHIEDDLVSELCPLSSLPTAKQCFLNRISFHPQAKRWGGACTKSLFWALLLFPLPQKVGCKSKWCKERNNGIGRGLV